MPITLKLKRRATGSAGAPASLKSGELAHNEVDNTIYVGKGDDGAGNATSVFPVAGQGAYVDKFTDQTIFGQKSFFSSPEAPTLSVGENSDKLASTSFVVKAVSGAGYTNKATPVDADAFSFGDSAASFGLKRLTWSNIKSTLAAHFNGLYAAIGHTHASTDVSDFSAAAQGQVGPGINAATAKASPVDADVLPVLDSAASYGLKKFTITNLKAILKTYFDTLYATASHVHTFASLTSKPTTVAGYGITDGLTAAMVGAASGVAGLGADGKVPTTQLPAAVLGGLQYQGTWNASTNTPALPTAAAANKGYFWKVATAGATVISGESDWKVGDWAVSNGASFDKVDNTDQVSTVAGRTGAVVLAYSDVSGLNTMAQQASSNVAITGGTISGVDFDGGTF